MLFFRRWYQDNPVPRWHLRSHVQLFHPTLLAALIIHKLVPLQPSVSVPSGSPTQTLTWFSGWEVPQEAKHVTTDEKSIDLSPGYHRLRAYQTKALASILHQHDQCSSYCVVAHNTSTHLDIPQVSYQSPLHGEGGLNDCVSPKERWWFKASQQMPASMRHSYPGTPVLVISKYQQNAQKATEICNVFRKDAGMIHAEIMS